MSNDNWDFGPTQNKPTRSSGSVLNTVILVIGVIFFFLYGIFKLVNPQLSVGASGLSIAANISGALGVILIIVAIVRIRIFNRRKTRGY